MSSDEENRFDRGDEIREYNSDNEETSNVENSQTLDDISGPSNDNQSANEHASASDEQPGKIMEDELPHSGNTISFKTKFESQQSDEERRAERRRERRRRRKLTEEEDGPSEGTAKTTANKFENGEIDDVHFQKTDTSHDSMAQSGTVMSTTEKFKSGKYRSESEDESKTNKTEDVEVVESGTAAARRKALEDYAEETKKGHTNSPKVLEEDAPVLKPGRAANTRAKLEKMSSEEKVLEKEVDFNTPKSGTASARRARFEERARQASVEEAPRQTARTARRSKWPEPNTNYRQRRGELRKSTSTDEEACSSVERMNAKNIEKSFDNVDGHHEREDVRSPSTTEASSDEAPKSPVKTSEIRNKLVKMLSGSEDERSASPPADLGNARPVAGTARNLRARFEGNKQTEESHFHSKKPSINSRAGYASRVREKFESGEVSHRRPSTAEEDDDSVTTDPETRRRRASSTRSVEAETSMMSRSAKELRNRFENPSQNTQVVKRNFVLRPKASTANITAKFNKTAPATNKCTACSKTVYPMEMITADDKSFHKKCFKCTECKATLRLGNYAALQGQIYCKPHFKQLFKVKGNYDEGFGRQQHKKHWEEKTKNENASEDQKSEENHEVDSNANIKVDADDTPHENGYDHPPEEHTNGYDSAGHEDAFISDDALDDGITT